LFGIYNQAGNVMNEEEQEI